MSEPPTPDKAEANADTSIHSPEEETEEKAMADLGQYENHEVKEQDRWLPIANVAKIMKTSLPDNAKIAREAKECMQECVSEFISFITSEASEKCQQEKRKTVNGEDIIFAMQSLGFENYAEAAKIYLTKYRETQTAKSENQAAGGGRGHGARSGSGNTQTTPSLPSPSSIAAPPLQSPHPYSPLPPGMHAQHHPQHHSHHQLMSPTGVPIDFAYPPEHQMPMGSGGGAPGMGGGGGQQHHPSQMASVPPNY